MEPRRELTEGETQILEMIRDHYGPQNTTEDVFFDERDQAVIFVKTGGTPTTLFANLTNLARFRLDGTIKTDKELRKDWLRME